MSKQKNELKGIEETLLITLWARSVESGNSNPILIDRKAEEIVSQIDYDFAKLATAKTSQLNICLRGLAIDNWAKKFLEEHPTGTIVEIGAGLNTRFERIDNGTVQWFDLDLPDAMTMRRKFFKDTDRQHSISGSILDNEWIDIVKGKNANQPIMFIAEGVLIYLSEDRVKNLFSTLVTQFPGCLFAFDSISSISVQSQNKHDSLKNFNASFDWSIENINLISDWNSEYQILDVHRTCDSPQQYLKRMPLRYRLGMLIPRIANSSRLALVKLGVEQ